MKLFTKQVCYFCNKLKIVILAVVLSTTLFTSAATPVYAIAITDPSGTRTAAWNLFLQSLGSAVGSSLQKYTVDVLSYVIQGGVLIVGGCEKNSANCPKKFEKGANSALGDMVAMTYSAPPASGIVYFASLIENFGLVKPAYAQTGTGFNALGPIADIWRNFRNLTYVIFVLIFVISGFAIMFRWKLNPQTVITIQSALPRIVVALLLVTFSFAIAGLLIDFMYVIIALSAQAFGGIGPPARTAVNGTALSNSFTSGGFWDLTGALFSLVDVRGRIVVESAAGIAGIIGAIVAGAFGLIGGVGAGIGVALVILIVLLIMLTILIRLFLQLLQSYIAIILLTIFGPLQIALGVIPGMPGFSSWLRSLTANILVFPAVAFVLMLGQVLVQHVDTVGLWAPPLLIASGGVGEWTGAIIGIGILLVVNQIPQVVRNAFGLRGLGIAPEQALGPTGLGREGAQAGIGGYLKGASTKGGLWDALYNLAKARRWTA